MKMIVAVIKPFKLDDVRKALLALGIEGLTITDVKGFGRQRGQTEIDHGQDYQVSYLPKTKIEVVVNDDKAKAAREAISEAAATGHIGDGKIFVLDVQEAVRIRTGDHGDDAL